MQLTATPWDEKITGLKSCEIVFARGDTFDDYLDAAIEETYEFAVVKVPVGDLSLVHKLEDCGYRYLENQLQLSFSINQSYGISPLEERLLKGFSCRRVDTDEALERILNEVDKKMFDTDRFSTDPLWNDDLSSVRYRNWVSDLYRNENVQIYIIEKEGKETGFFSMKRDSDRTNSCPIAGIFNKYKSVGYIFVLTWFWFLKCREMGCTRLNTAVSSNNRIMLSSLSKVFLFSIRDTYIVMRKVVKK